jgi:hypothetical protein
MPRGASAAMKAAAAKKVVYPVAFMDGQFVSGHLYLWSGVGQIQWNGQTWTGAGRLIGVSSVAEAGDLKANNLVITLSGVPNDLVMKALTEVQHGLTGTLYLGLMNESGQVVDALPLFVGLADVATLKRGRSESTIAVTYELRTLDYRGSPARYTQQDQQIDYPGDNGFSFVNSLQNQNLSNSLAGWGSPGGTPQPEPPTHSGFHP